MPNYRVAIIGTGRMGGLIEDELNPNQFSSPYGHYPAYQSIPETEVIAIANRGKERLARFSQRFGCSNQAMAARIDHQRATTGLDGAEVQSAVQVTVVVGFRRVVRPVDVIA